MRISRLRVAFVAGIAIVAVWLVVLAGYIWTQHSKVTSDKVSKYISAINLSALTDSQRAAAIAELARQINALTSEERMRMYARRAWDGWFRQMSEKEKASFVEATLPTGIKQMMTAFEQMPEAARKKTLGEAMKRLREAHELPLPNNPSSQQDQAALTNSPSPVSAELERRMQTVGLKTFYTGSSAQTKAEVAPLLEEMQRLMENGAVLR